MRIFSIMLFFFLFYQHVSGQQQEIIKGIVADSATYKPLPYVNIRIKNVDRGVRSDERGNFIIQAKPQDTLVFSFVGYKTIEVALWDWEPSVVLMAEAAFMLETIIIQDKHLEDPYKNLFNDEYARWEEKNKRLPFYYSKKKKEKIKVNRLEEENLRVSTYLNVVLHNPEVKNNLIKKYRLTESEYYSLLTKFNETHHKVMYYLSASELLSLLHRFFNDHASTTK